MNSKQLGQAALLSLLLTGCTSDGRPGFLGDVGAPDYGAREMPKIEKGETYDHYWKRLCKEDWF